MDASTSEFVRHPVPEMPESRPAARQLEAAARREYARELADAYEDGRRDGNTDSWISGAKIGGFCGWLLGMGMGAGITMAAIHYGRAFA